MHSVNCKERDDVCWFCVYQCISQVADDYAFTAAAVRAMQDSCEEMFLTNTSLWEIDPSSNGTKRPPKTISDTLCPNLCSGNGVCRKRFCVCAENYTSPDCSIDKSKGPKIESVPLDGLCDIRKRNDCYLVKVKGSNFLDSSNLTCRSTALQVLSIVNEKPIHVKFPFSCFMTFYIIIYMIC